MKKITILVTYLLFILPSAHADLKKLTQEYFKNNFDLYKAQNANDVAELGYQIENSKYNWNLSAGTSYSDSNLKSFTSSSITDIQSTIHSLTLSKGFDWGGTFSFTNTLEQHKYSSEKSGFTQGLNYSQDIGKNFFGSQSKNLLEISQKNIKVTNLSTELNKESHLYSFASLYVRGALLKSLLDYQSEAYQRALKRRNLVRRRVKDGLREKVDLYQAENTLLKSEEDLITAENNLNDILEKLSNKLHRQISKSEINYLQFEGVNLSNKTSKESLGVKVLNEKKELIAKELSNSKSDLLPSLSLDLGYKTNNYDAELSNALSEGTLGGDNSEISAAITLSWNIGRDAEKAKHTMKKIESMTIQKELDKEKKNIDILIQIIKIKIKNLDEIISSSQKRILLAQKTLTEYNSLYNKGRVDLDTVIRAEEGLINTQRSYISHLSSHRELTYSLSLLFGDLKTYILR